MILSKVFTKTASSFDAETSHREAQFKKMITSRFFLRFCYEHQLNHQPVLLALLLWTPAQSPAGSSCVAAMNLFPKICFIRGKYWIQRYDKECKIIDIFPEKIVSLKAEGTIKAASANNMHDFLTKVRMLTL